MFTRHKMGKDASDIIRLETDIGPHVTMLLNFHSYKKTRTQKFFQEIIPKLQSRHPIAVASRHPDVMGNFRTNGNSFQFVQTQANEPDGQVWNRLADEAKTPFVLIVEIWSELQNKNTFFGCSRCYHLWEVQS